MSDLTKCAPRWLMALAAATWIGCADEGPQRDEPAGGDPPRPGATQKVTPIDAAGPDDAGATTQSNGGNGNGHDEHGNGNGYGHCDHGNGWGYGHPPGECVNEVLLTVRKTGSGTGVVASSLPGIDCGASCEATYAVGDTVTLTATADPGSTFDGWSGGGCTGTGTCTVTMSAATTVGATFTRFYPLTVIRTGTGDGAVTSSPAGIDCGADCTEDYADGTTVTLTAAAMPGSRFDGWSGGGCTGTGPCSVAIGAATTVTATFTRVFALTVTRDGTGDGVVTSTPAGIDCGADCAEDYDDGTTVTLTAAADPTSRFVGWSGGCAGSAPTCTVTMTAATAVTATFVRRATLTVVVIGDGAVTSAPAGIDCGAACTLEVDVPTAVALAAQPGPGMIVRSWSEPTCTGLTCDLTVAADATVTVTFGLPILTVIPDGTGTGTVTSDLAGITCGADCMNEYPAGSIVTLTAVPTPGQRFDGWTGPCIDPGHDAPPPVVLGNSCRDGTDNDTDGLYGCSDPDCATDAFCTTCGNGVVDTDETCDDGNRTRSDGCSASCQTEPGYTCRFPGRPCVITMCEVATVTGSSNYGVFERNNYVEIGMHQNGAFGTTTAPSPTGWHWRSNQIPREIGFVADPEGTDWTNYHGDFFVPGTPEEGWAMVVGSTVYNNNRVGQLTQMPGEFGAPECLSNLCGQRDGARVSWTSTQPVGDQVDVRQDYTILDGGVFILIDVYLTNVTGADLTNVYYMRNVDPDNDQSRHGNYTTTNTILAEPSATDDLAMVRASQNYAGVPPSALALVARDERARVSWGGFSVRDPRDVWNGTGGLSHSGTSVNDIAISIAFKVDIPAGQTVGFRYAYNLEANASDVLTCVEHVDPFVCVVEVDEDVDVTATFSRITVPLTVSKTGTGTGTITSAPAGIDCGTTCTTAFDKGTLVTLTATPDPGSRFAGWTGACSGTGPCTLSMFGARQAIAQFIRQETLTVIAQGNGNVTSAPSGISCGVACAWPFDVGTFVTLTATPLAGYGLVRWEGAAGCTNASTCVVVVNAPTTVTAVFAPTLPLTVVRQGSGGGTVSSSPVGISCGTQCTGAFATGAVVTLTAVTDPGSRWDGWTGPCAGALTDTQCVVTMAAATTVTATFTRMYTLTIAKSGDGSGRISSSPAGIDCGLLCAAQFPAGTLMTLTPEPAPGSVFAGWGVTNTRTFSVTGSVFIPDNNPTGATLSMTVPDSFAFASMVATVEITHTWIGDLRVTLLHDNVQVAVLHANSGGSADNIFQSYPLAISGNSAGVWTLRAVDSAGSDVGFLRKLQLDFNALSFTPGTLPPFPLDANTTINAAFSAAELLTVVKAGTGGGTVTSSPAGVDCGPTCASYFARGSTVTLTAANDADSTFLGWSGPCTGTGSCTVTLDVARTVTATFARGHALTVARTGTGTGTVTSAPAGISCGTTCSAILDVATLTATPAAGSRFAGWSGGGCTGTGTCTVTVTAATLVTAQFELDGPDLTIAFAGDGVGTVATVPGVPCTSDCVHSYTLGSTLSVVPTAGTDSVFAGWSGACSGTGPCTVTMDGARSLTATFNLIRYPLVVAKTGSGAGLVTSAPAGIDCGSDCSEDYLIHTTVTLTATASPGARFAGWTGACSGTGACTVTMEGARTVGATFVALRTLTVAVTGSGSVTSAPAGISCGLLCAFVYDQGTVVTLTATPAAGQVVASWTAPGCSGAICNVTITADTTVAVTFAPQAVLTVARAGTGTGTVTSVPAGINCGATCSAAFAVGQTVTLTASPGTNSVFAGWSGACSGTGPCTVTLSGATTVTASFTFAYTLTVQRLGNGHGSVTSAPAGIACGATCTTSFLPGTVVTLTAAADDDSLFVQWSDGVTTPTRVVTMNSNLTLGAIFNADFTLTVAKAGSGRGTLYEATFDYTCDADTCSGFTGTHLGPGFAVHLTATAQAGSVFVGWTGACSGSGPTCDVVMTTDTTITATFSRVHALTIARAGAGTGRVTGAGGAIDCGSACSTTVLEDVLTDLVATADPGSVFVGWSPALAGCTGATCALTITSATTLTATFARAVPLTVTVADGAGVGAVRFPDGSTCTATCVRELPENQSITLTALPAAGLLAWSGDCTGTAGCTVVMSAARSVTATFRPRYPLAVARLGAGSGTVSSTPAGIDCGDTCTASYFETETVTLTAIPDDSSAFLGWSGGCTNAFGPCTVTIAGATAVQALFDVWQDPDLVAIPPVPTAPDDPEAIYDQDGNRVFAVSGDGEIKITVDTTPSATSALAACSLTVAHCVQVDGGTLDECMFSMPRCTTDQPWTEPVECCAPACWDAYRESRRLGEDPVEAFAAALFERPSCMPGVDPLRGVPTAAPSTTFAQEMLDLHNERRARHCVPPLEWNNDLAVASATYADVLLTTGVWQHSPEAIAGEHGENLEFDTIPMMPDVWRAGLWYEEIEGYDFSNPGQALPGWTGFDGQIGHFTQLVWMRNQSVGCGKASNGTRTYLVCKYGPGGNVTGDYERNVLPLCVP